MRGKRFIFILLAAASLPLSGCHGNVLPKMSEIGQFEVIQVFGVDKSAERPGEVEVTMVAGKAKQSSGEGSPAGKYYDIMSLSAPTVFEAATRMNHYSDKKQHFGYIDYFIIGEAAAREDLTKYTDFFTRDYEARYSTKIFVTRGCTAREFLNKTTSEDKYISDALDNIQETVNAVSDTQLLNSIDLIYMLDNPDGAAVIPALRCVSPDYAKMVGGEQPEATLIPAGYAVARDYKLVGFIEADYARGYNFLTGRACSSPVSVTSPSGATVAVEIIHGDVSTEQSWDGDKLKSVTYKLRLQGNVSEQHAREDVYTGDALHEISTKTADALRGEMERVIEQSQKLKIDCTALGDKLRMRHPLRWDGIKDRWRELYPELEIKVEVALLIRRPYDIREPNGFDMDKREA